MKKFLIFGLVLIGVVMVAALVTSANGNKVVENGPLSVFDRQDEKAMDGDQFFHDADRMFEDFLKDFHGDHDRLFSRMDDDAFKNFDDHFKEMAQFRKEMESRFRDFDSAFGGNMGPGQDKDLSLNTREDDKAVYYDIDIGSIKPEDLNVDINGDMVTVTGKVSKNMASNDNGMKSEKQFYSQFVKSFPVPAGVDVNKSDVRIKEKQIEIEFPKN